MYLHIDTILLKIKDNEKSTYVFLAFTQLFKFKIRETWSTVSEGIQEGKENPLNRIAYLTHS